jgi:hypothetical protein
MLLGALGENALIVMGGIVLFFFAIITFLIVIMWKFFKKAGFKGYESLIPIHNLVVLIQIAGKPISYFFLLLIPIVNIIYMVKIINGISRSFGKGVGFTLGLIFLPIIFLPILVWGNSEYNATQEISRIKVSFHKEEKLVPEEIEIIKEEAVNEVSVETELVPEDIQIIAPNVPPVITSSSNFVPEGSIPEMEIVLESTIENLSTPASVSKESVETPPTEDILPEPTAEETPIVPPAQ